MDSDLPLDDVVTGSHSSSGSSSSGSSVSSSNSDLQNDMEDMEDMETYAEIAVTDYQTNMIAYMEVISYSSILSCSFLFLIFYCIIRRR